MATPPMTIPAQTPDPRSEGGVQSGQQARLGGQLLCLLTLR